MARDYSVGQRLLYAACGIAIMVVGSIVEKRHFISDRGIEALLWLVALLLAALVVFLARALLLMWRTPKLDDDTLSMPARSDRWIAAYAKVLAKRQRPSLVFARGFLLPMIVCLFLSVSCLWAVLGHTQRSGSLSAGDAIGILGAAIFLVMVFLIVALWRGLRDSERHLARMCLQRSSKAIDP